MDRLMKLTEENVQKQQELEKNLSADKNPKSGRSAQTKPKSSNGSLYYLVVFFFIVLYVDLWVLCNSSIVTYAFQCVI